MADTWKMDLLKCCFGCATVLGCKSVIVRKTAFFPPSPPGYSFLDVENPGSIRLREATGDLRCPEAMPWLSTTVLVLQTSRRSRIPCVYFRHPKSEFVLLFCHGNSTDLGFMWKYMSDLASQLTCSVFLFEYTGYGPLPGRPSEAALYADIRAAYSCLIEDLGVSWSHIVVYGQSIGSAVACDLASELPCAGVILHSPIASGLRIFAKRETKMPSYDIFRNVEKVPYIRCPIFILHGTADLEVPIRHSEWLSRLVPLQSPPWWVLDGGHNDIEVRFRREYLAHLIQFLAAVQQFQLKHDSDAALLEATRPFSKTTPVTEIPAAHCLFLPL